MQPSAPLGLSAIAVAATVPLVSALPVATAQVPTVASAPVASALASTGTADPTVTVIAAADGVGSGEAPRPVRSVPDTTTADPDTDLTVPNAVANSRPPPPGAPDGPAPPPGAPDGGAPRCSPPLGNARGVPFGRATVQAPPVDTTRTETAVSAAPDPGVPATVTQSPAASVAGTDLVNLVDADHVTAVCDELFCTCSVRPDTAAISPDAAGPRPPAPSRAAADAAADAAGAALEGPPHPVSSRTATGSPAASVTTVERVTDTPLWTEGMGQSLRRASIGASRAARPAG